MPAGGAISYQESHWDPLAPSPTGVRGLMMLTQKYRPKSGADRPYRCGAKHQRRRSRYLEDMMAKVPETVPEDERVPACLSRLHMGYAHMLSMPDC